MKLLHLTKPGLVEEYDWELPTMAPDQICVKTKLVGVCRSDIGNYTGAEAMPYSTPQNPEGKLGTWGHEGLGEVIAIGRSVKTDVKIGDVVATYSDPAYADCYYAKDGEFVIVPSVDPKYILQPVACGINVFNQLDKYYDGESKILLLGSGFLSTIIGACANKCGYDELYVVGNANKEIWNKLGYTRYNSIEELIFKPKFKYIIDLSSKAENFDNIAYNLGDEEAFVAYAATPQTPVTTNFFQTCWNCHTLIFPSPRNKDFNKAMKIAKELVEDITILDVNKLWSKGYDRKTEYKQAFEDGANRTPNYVRGYLKW